jgi:hypothetical protein
MDLLRRAWDHTTADPVLVVGNPFDPATPLPRGGHRGPAAAPVAAAHPGRLGHTSLSASARIDRPVNTCLITTRVPPRGTVCAPDVVPFAHPPAARAQRAAGAPKAAPLPPAIRRLLLDG